MYKICIIIPCWHNANLSEMAIHSALEVEDSYVIAINNNSPDEGKTLELFNKLERPAFSNLLLERNEENLGWVGGINQGVKLMPHCEYVCFLNTDAVLPHNCGVPCDHVKYIPERSYALYRAREIPNNIILGGGV